MSAAAALAVQVQGLRRRFGTIEALCDVSFQITAGEIFGLVGADGAGKTTLMRLLAGVLRPDEGSIRVNGTDVVAQPELAKLQLSYMPQRFGLYEELTVAENLRFYADLFRVDRRAGRERAQQLLRAAGLTGFEKRRAGQLSGGMKQKLGLICSLIHTPSVLLLDEPTTGVDPISRRDFWSILYTLRERGVTIVLTTAYMDEAERCSRLALLQAGRIRQCDTPAKLKQAMPGALLAVTAHHPQAVYTALAGAAGVLGLLLMGDQVHVRVDDAPRRLPQLQALLQARAAQPVRIEAIEPGIEDVFVALLPEETRL